MSTQSFFQKSISHALSNDVQCLYFRSSLVLALCAFTTSYSVLLGVPQNDPGGFSSAIWLSILILPLLISSVKRQSTTRSSTSLKGCLLVVSSALFIEYSRGYPASAVQTSITGTPLFWHDWAVATPTAVDSCITEPTLPAVVTDTAYSSDNEHTQVWHHPYHFVEKFKIKDDSDEINGIKVEFQKINTNLGNEGNVDIWNGDGNHDVFTCPNGDKSNHPEDGGGWEYMNVIYRTDDKKTIRIGAQMGGCTYHEEGKSDNDETTETYPALGPLTGLMSSNKKDYFWPAWNVCACPGSQFVMDEIDDGAGAVLEVFVNEIPGAVSNNPNIFDTIGARYGQNCGSFRASLAPNSITIAGNPSANVPDFLTVDANTGQVTLQTTKHTSIGTHTVELIVDQPLGYDQTGICGSSPYNTDWDGFCGIASKIPTLYHHFDVLVKACPIDITANTQAVTAYTHYVGFPSDTSGDPYNFNDNDTRACYSAAILESITCYDNSGNSISCATLGVTLDSVNKQLNFAVTDTSLIGDYLIVVKRESTATGHEALYDSQIGEAWHTGNSWASDKEDQITFTLTVEPCPIASITHTDDFTDAPSQLGAVTYSLGSGTQTITPLSFQEDPLTATVCNYGFTITQSWSPTDPTAHYVWNNAVVNGDYQITSTSSAFLGTYQITVTGALNMDAATKTWHTNKGYSVSEDIVIDLTVEPCFVSSIDHTGDFSDTYRLQDPSQDTTTLFFTEVPASAQVCNYGLTITESWSPSKPTGLSTWVNDPINGKYSWQSSDLAHLGTYTITVTANLNVDALIAAAHTSEGYSVSEDIVITLIVQMCETTTFGFTQFTVDEPQTGSLTLGDPQYFSQSYLATDPDCGYTIQYSVTWPSTPVPISGTQVPHGAVNRRFIINWPLTVANFAFVDQTYTITVEARVLEPLDASYSPHYPYSTANLIQDFTWDLTLDSPCPSTILQGKTLPDLVGLRGDIFYATVDVFTDTIAEAFGMSGILCGEQTQTIRVDNSLSTGIAWVTETPSGTFAAQNYKNYIVFDSSFAPYYRDLFKITVLAQMVDYPTKTVTSEFNVALLTPSLSITNETVKYYIGNDTYNNTFTHSVSPLGYDSYLVPEFEAYVVTEDGELEELPPFMDFLIDAQNITVYTSWLRWAGNYTIRIISSYPAYPGYSIFVEFDLEVIPPPPPDLGNLLPYFEDEDDFVKLKEFKCNDTYFTVIPKVLDRNTNDTAWLHRVDFNTLFSAGIHYKHSNSIAIGEGFCRKNDTACSKKGTAIAQNRLDWHYHGDHVITYVLEDSRGARRFVNQPIRVDCPPPVVPYTGPPHYEYVWADEYLEFNITKTNQIGQVRVDFNKQMIPPVNLSDITNGTVYINETFYPKLAVRMWAADYDLTQQDDLNFTWECLNFTENYMIIQMWFHYPERVSWNIPYDNVQLTFWDQHSFKSVDGLVTSPDANRTRDMPNQYHYEPGQKILAYSSVYVGVLYAAVTFAYLTSIYVSGRVNELLKHIRKLQLVVHMFLVQVAVPGNATLFNSRLLNLISFDFLPVHTLYDRVFGWQRTEALTLNFELSGYESGYFIRNIGTMFLLVAAFPLAALTAQCTKLSKEGRIRDFGDDIKQRLYWGSIFSFLLETYLILGTCAALNIRMLVFDEETPDATNWGYWASLVFSLVFAATLIFLAVFIPALLLSNKLTIIDHEPDFYLKYNYLFKDLRVRRMGRVVFLVPTFEMNRSLLIAVTIVFGGKHPNFQNIGIMVLSLLQFSIVGLIRPFKLPLQNYLDMFQEAIILILSYHLMVLNRIVYEPLSRHNFGTSIIVFESLFLAATLASILAEPLYQLYRKYYLNKLLQEKLNDLKKKSRIDEYRRKQINKYNKEKKNNLAGDDKKKLNTNVPIGAITATGALHKDLILDQPKGHNDGVWDRIVQANKNDNTMQVHLKARPGKPVNLLSKIAPIANISSKRTRNNNRLGSTQNPNDPWAFASRIPGRTEIQPSVRNKSPRKGSPKRSKSKSFKKSHRQHDHSAIPFDSTFFDNLKSPDNDEDRFNGTQLTSQTKQNLINTQTTNVFSQKHSHKSSYDSMITGNREQRDRHLKDVYSDNIKPEDARRADPSLNPRQKELPGLGPNMQLVGGLGHMVYQPSAAHFSPRRARHLKKMDKQIPK